MQILKLPPLNQKSLTEAQANFRTIEGLLNSPGNNDAAIYSKIEAMSDEALMNLCLHLDYRFSNETSNLEDMMIIHEVGAKTLTKRIVEKMTAAQAKTLLSKVFLEEPPKNSKSQNIVKRQAKMVRDALAFYKTNSKLTKKFDPNRRLAHIWCEEVRNVIKDHFDIK